MKKIQFQKVGMKNYGPYIDPLEYKIEPNTLTLITGPNGIGKTMSLDAIPYTLYGIRSNGARGDDVVNNKIKKNCRTWVEFKINNDLYRVDRYHKYKKLANTVTLKKNGEVIKKGQKDVLPEVERIVLPRKLFMNTIMFGQKVKDFFTDLTDSEKKDIFRKVLALDNYLNYYEKAKARTNEYKQSAQTFENEANVNARLLVETENNIIEQTAKRDQFTSEKQRKINDFKKQLNEEKKHLKGLQLRFKDYSEDEARLQLLIETITKAKSEIEIVNQKFNSRIDDLNNASRIKILELSTQTNDAISKINEEYSHLSDLVKDEINEATESFNKEYNKEIENKHKAEVALTRLLANLKSLKAEETKYLNALSSDSAICPTCNQSLVNKDHIEKKSAEIVDKIFILNKSISKYNSQIEGFEKTLKVLENYRDTKLVEMKNKLQPLLDDKYTKTQDVNTKLDAAKEQVNVLLNVKTNEFQTEQNKLLEALKISYTSSNMQKHVVEEKITKMKEIEKLISSQTEAINRTTFLLDKVDETLFDDTELKRAEYKKQTYEAAIEKLNNELSGLVKKTDVCEFWKQAFSQTGIPSMLIDESVPFMNEKVSEYLDKISNGRYIVSFDTLAETKSGEFRDKISVHVLDTQTQANSRLQFSGGQTRLVDIATILTLGDLQSSVQEVEFNILLFDEILDSLDDTNIGYVSKVIKSLANDKSIFIISHRHVDQLEADEVYNYA